MIFCAYLVSMNRKLSRKIMNYLCHVLCMANCSASCICQKLRDCQFICFTNTAWWWKFWKTNYFFIYLLCKRKLVMCDCLPYTKGFIFNHFRSGTTFWPCGSNIMISKHTLQFKLTVNLKLAGMKLPKNNCSGNRISYGKMVCFDF